MATGFCKLSTYCRHLTEKQCLTSSMTVSMSCVQDKISTNFYTSRYVKKIIIQLTMEILQVDQIVIQNELGHHRDTRLRTQKKMSEKKSEPSSSSSSSYNKHVGED
ncbi:unnamed protein product [Rotaria socialis]|uniref:Uncharacterized protein n=1 Tax=Rotaria socialis TaxID=392032 RepID=A0A820HWQ6_9BILA|nr:unnamed protein product [Rotaria socialis]